MMRYRLESKEKEKKISDMAKKEDPNWEMMDHRKLADHRDV